MFFTIIINLEKCEFVIKLFERFFDIFIVFFGALSTAFFGYMFWLKRHQKELSIEYQGEYLSNIGKFLNLTQIEVELREDNKNNVNSQKIYENSLERTKIEYQIDMARVKMRINKIDDYVNSEGKIYKIDEMFKKVFVIPSEKYNKDKQCTKWKAFTKIEYKHLKPKDIDSIEKEIDEIREYLKQNF